MPSAESDSFDSDNSSNSPPSSKTSGLSRSNKKLKAILDSEDDDDEVKKQGKSRDSDIKSGRAKAKDKALSQVFSSDEEMNEDSAKPSSASPEVIELDGDDKPDSKRLNKATQFKEKHFSVIVAKGDASKGLLMAFDTN
jgi:hypothetical protein